MSHTENNHVCNILLRLINFPKITYCSPFGNEHGEFNYILTKTLLKGEGVSSKQSNFWNACRIILLFFSMFFYLVFSANYD